MATERKESKGKVYTIPVRQITGNTNPRNPLAKALQAEGWTIFGTGDKVMWPLAISDDPGERKRFTDLMQEHDPEFCSWAATFITQGQLQAIEVREGGSGTYTVCYGMRRVLAVLYNWCLTGVPKEPVIDAKLTKGNSVSMLQRAIVENRRRDPNPIEEATAIQYAVNQGMSLDDVAEQQGYTKQTIQRKLSLLELPLPRQKRVAEGKLTVAKALNGDGEEGAAGGKPVESKPPAMRKRKEIVANRAEFAEDRLEYRLLSWVLGEREDWR